MKKPRFVFALLFVAFLVIGSVIPGNFGVFRQTDFGDPKEFLVEIHNKCLANFSKRSEYLNCVTNATKSFVQTRGLSELVTAGEEVNRNNLIDLVGSINCHDMMHALGRSGGVNMKNYQVALSECRPLCGAGCYHGVLETRYGAGDDLKKFVTEACSFTQTDKKYESQCYHGLGHAVAVEAGNIYKSIEYCDLAPEEGHLGCASGAFMELFTGDPTKTSLIPLNVPEWCFEFKGVYGDICWLSAGYFRGRNVYLDSIGIDTGILENEAIYNCSKAPTEQLRLGCVYTVGDNIYNIANEDLGVINGICVRFGKDLAGWCLKGAAHSAKRNHPSGNQHIELCEKNSDLAIVSQCKSEFVTN